jgi:cytosine/adenosine deaminase-related metal-dependent hydrolase
VTNINDGGLIEPGSAADMLLLDWDALDEDGLRDDIDPINMLFSRATAGHIRELIVGGRTIVRDRQVLGIDLPRIRNEVLSQMRSGMAANRTLSSALSALEQAVARFHLSDPPCC